MLLRAPLAAPLLLLTPAPSFASQASSNATSCVPLSSSKYCAAFGSAKINVTYLAERAAASQGSSALVFAKVHDVASLDAAIEAWSYGPNNVADSLGCSGWNGDGWRYRSSYACQYLVAVSYNTTTYSCDPPSFQPIRLCYSTCLDFIGSLNETSQKQNLCPASAAPFIQSNLKQFVHDCRYYAASPTDQCVSAVASEQTNCGYGSTPNEISLLQSYCNSDGETGTCCNAASFTPSTTNITGPVPAGQTPVATSLSSTTPSSSISSTTIIVIGAVGGMALITIIVILLVCSRLRRKRRARARHQEINLPAGVRQIHDPALMKGTGVGLPPGRRITESSAHSSFRSGTLGAMVVDTPGREWATTRYVAITSYTPALDDEMELRVGDIVTLTSLYNDGWAAGVNISTGQVASVPTTALQAMELGRSAAVERTQAWAQEVSSYIGAPPSEPARSEGYRRTFSDLGDAAPGVTDAEGATEIVSEVVAADPVAPPRTFAPAAGDRRRMGRRRGAAVECSGYFLRKLRWARVGHGAGRGEWTIRPEKGVVADFRFRLAKTLLLHRQPNTPPSVRAACGLDLHDLTLAERTHKLHASHPNNHPF
ncbi:hypothetical protein BDK51DRAFT_27833 [Blyttiomyces helicus]|uniref:SH3 domain-containing protein n=1 Tax=Blyttiomyces helicus TaxID=388810 RepID=A0A4P9W6Z3_9FUNG|nr:hypothetical protein BDK51DRAFT_27833 [Blyttiomyces helicus]|eukprot:RKO88229.1 hypothetical protein BDK51DRAFT_27833 [Blyttiomyces helicus]